MLSHETSSGRIDRQYHLTGDNSRGYPETILETDDFTIITGRANLPLVREVGRLLNQEIHETAETFADGEARIRIQHNIRRRDIFIVQPTSPPVNDNLMELIFMVDAAKRSSASEITAVVPYFGYARQDRKDRSRVPISASTVAKMIENAGADRILTLDIHSDQQQGFVSIPWDNLYGSISLIPELIEKRSNGKLIVASPDKGGVARATAFAKRLNAQGIAIVFKDRDVNMINQSEALDMIGDVDNAEVLIVDDIVDTAGTIVNAADMLIKRGARKVSVAATHGLFSENEAGSAVERINKSQISEVTVTDSVKLKDEALTCSKIHVVSIAPLIAEAIKRIYVGESLSDLIT